MLKKLFTLSLIFIGALTLAACDPTEEGPTVPEILEMIQEAEGNLTLPSETSTDLTLPNSEVHDVVITWESSNTDVIANDGTVTIPTKTEGNKTVTITASLTLEGQTLEKEFTVTVNAAADFSNQELLDQAVAALLLDAGIKTSDIALPLTGAHETTITWESSNTAVVANDGTVTRPANGDGNAMVTLTATVAKGDLTATKTFNVQVAEEEPSNVVETIAGLHSAGLSLGDVVEFQGIVSALTDGGFFMTDGTDNLSVYMGADVTFNVGDEVYVKGEYAKYNTTFQIGGVMESEVISTGNAVGLTPVETTVAEILAMDSSDPLLAGKFFIITGTVDIQGSFNNIYIVDGDDQVLISYYSLEASLDALEAEVGKEVTITVFYYTEHGTNGVMLGFDGLAEDITINVLADDVALAADLGAVDASVPDAAVADIMLPTEGANGTVYTNWTSDNTAVFGNDGTFVAKAASTVTVTFTADATRGTETGTATVEVVVPLEASLGEIVAMDNYEYFETSGVIYSISKYGWFIHANDEYVFVYAKNQVEDEEAVEGDEVTIIGKRGSYNGLVQVNIISWTNNSSDNALPTTVTNGTVEGILGDLYMDGTPITITATVTREGEYNNVHLAGVTGAQVVVYYHTDDEAFFDLVDKVVTVEVIPYQDGLVLFHGEATDITEETGYTASDAEIAQAVADLLDLGDLSDVYADLDLPDTYGDTGAVITWASDDEAVVGDDGAVTTPFGSTASATLTATVTVGTDAVTREFEVTLGDGLLLDPITVTEAYAILDDDDETNNYILLEGIVVFNRYGRPFIQDETGKGLFVYANLGLDVGDKVIVRGTVKRYINDYGQNMPEMDGDTELVSVVSTGNSVPTATLDLLPADFAENYLDHYAGIFRMTLEYKGTSSAGGDDFYNFVGFVDESDADPANHVYIDIKFDQEWLDYDFDAVYEAGDTITMTFIMYDFRYDDVRVIPMEVPLLTNAQKLLVAEAEIDIPATVVVDLTLPTTIGDVTVVWASDNAAIGTDGTVTRPSNGDGDASVVLTATLSITGETDVVLTFNVTVTEEAVAAVPDLFISEYAEADGGSCKYIEIYNPTDATVDLTSYGVNKASNGGGWGTEFTLSGTLASGETVVVRASACTSGTDGAQTEGNPAFPTSGLTEFTWSNANWNGDDAVGLFKDGVLIDVIGTPDADPGSSWNVGNGNTTDGNTANTILIRIPTVTSGTTDWAVGATQWIVVADDRDYSDVGTHTSDAPAT